MPFQNDPNFYQSTPYTRGEQDYGNYGEAGGKLADGMRTVKDAVVTMVVGPLMVKTFQNWKERTGDNGIAFYKAMFVGWVWKAWLFTLFVWIVEFMMGGYWAMQEKDRLAVQPNYPDAEFTMALLNAYRWANVLVLIPTVGFIYVRLNEMSLLNRGRIYRFLRVIDTPFRWIPWPVLMSMVLVPFFIVVVGRWVTEGWTIG